jgi:hypothetical protein
MPYDSSDAIEDNLERDTDLDLGPLKRQVELDYNLTTPNNNAQNKISSPLLLAAACSNSS